MKKTTLLLVLCLGLFAASSCNGQNGEKEQEVLLETTAGNIRIRLFNDTPGHRDNFLKNVREGLYDGVSFHRIIRGFMIQTGDPNTRPGHEADLAAAQSDSAAPSPTIPAEIVYPKYFHKRGMVAAAREGDEVNPDRRSDATQFYIVTGKFQNEAAMASYVQARNERAVERLYEKKVQENAEELEDLRRARKMNKLSDKLESLLDMARLEVSQNPPGDYGPEQIRAYRTVGGAPWLDEEYSIFGEVVEGMKVVLDLEKTKTDANDRPVKDVRVVKATILN